MMKTWTLCTGAELNLGNRVLGEIEKKSFISAVPDWFLYYIYTYTTSLVAQTVKSVYNAGDLGSIPGLGRSPGEGNGNPLQD